MRYAFLLILSAGPAYAHHEAVTASVLPSMIIWSAVIASGLVAISHWYKDRRK